ncbi:hypothetical protein ECG_06143 [Echinococcus granulosus]|uniref:Secreted protein n=1 Tax=Echinococcus granulosus TaxID=6210 RepID=U6FVG1_ECHGR|nr:hypothetical protein ECG_06143 [Echinococcus granulosus]CDI70131.1 hypothetical protein EgrG_002061600 [Echinococcus granulosus]
MLCAAGRLRQRCDGMRYVVVVNALSPITLSCPSRYATVTKRKTKVETQPSSYTHWLFQTLLEINSQSHSGTNIFRPNELNHQPGTFIQHIAPAHQGGLVSATEKLCTTDTSASELCCFSQLECGEFPCPHRPRSTSGRHHLRYHWYRSHEVSTELEHTLIAPV